MSGYTRGAAGKRAGRHVVKGKISDARESWVRLHHLEAVVYIYDDFEEEPDRFECPGIPEVRLLLGPPGRRPLNLNLSAYTLEELDALQKFVNRAFDLARPSVAALDERAQKEFEAGDDSHFRMYRAVPQLHVRERTKPEHDPGVPG